MKKLILSMMLSADGHTARPDGDLGWFLSDRDFEDEMLGLLRSVDALLFGRKSYLELAGYWPSAGDPGAGDAPGGFSSRERAVEFARLMNGIPKVVITTTLARLDWGPASRIGGDLAADLRRLKSEPGRDLVLFAGASAAQSCMALDLVDEYRLMLHPVLLGNGLPLFGGALPELPLQLIAAQTFSSGVVLLRYARVRQPSAAATVSGR
ncbi:MAG TPA: dihydrofolate reductase family protein [Polyangiaceae bacterium]|nr:dihydrofolate reductase family protein [Polyangiaceae bacterium]